MYIEIYPDMVFVLNFLMDFLLLVLVKAVNRKQSKVWRMLAGAAAGGMCAVLISLLPWLNSISAFHGRAGLLRGLQIAVKLLGMPPMLLIAFGRAKWSDFLKQIISLFLITCFAGGLMNSLYYDTKLGLYLLHWGDVVILSNISMGFVIAVMTGVLFLAAGLLFLRRYYSRKDKEVYRVELSYEGRRLQTSGLMDTGNCLVDPLYHRPVIVIERELLKELLPGDAMDEFENTKHYLRGEYDGSESALALDRSGASGRLFPRLRTIPYTSVGNARGIMFGLMLDHILIHTGKECVCCNKVTAAISDHPLSPKEEYHVILHRELLI